MKHWLLCLLIAMALASGLCFSHLRPSTSALEALVARRDAVPLVSDSLTPVVVELFTSEGCSSCPPADALLQQLEQASPVPGAALIVLSEHVDYWNYIGWADPFSAPAYSARQQSYAQAFERRRGRGAVYTPQMIVDGQFEFVGNQSQQARAAIAQALALPKAHITITPVKSLEPTAMKFQLRITDLPPLAPLEQTEVLLAITESNLTSSVMRGENSGRKLRHTAVTRSLRVLTQFAGTQKSIETDAIVNLANDWQRSNLRLIALVQERNQRRILGAASLKLN
jgi:hypothetical protein